MVCGRAKEKNIEKSLKLVRIAAERGARIICLQELFHTHWFPKDINKRNFGLAEPCNGPTLEAMQSVAQENEVVLVCPIFEKDGDETFYNNTGGALTINLQGASGNTSYRNGAGASTTVNQTVTVALTVNDEDGDPLQNARVRITAAETVGTITTGDLILTGTTDVNGEIETTTFNYEGAFDPSGLDIEIKVRLHSSSPYYKPFDGAGVILNTGYSGTVGMTLDE